MDSRNLPRYLLVAIVSIRFLITLDKADSTQKKTPCQVRGPYDKIYKLTISNNMNYRYDIINEAYEVIATFNLEEEALTFVEFHRQYSYVKVLAPSVSNIQRLWDIS